MTSFGRLGQLHDTGAELIVELYFNNTPWKDRKPQRLLPVILNLCRKFIRLLTAFHRIVNNLSNNGW